MRNEIMDTKGVELPENKDKVTAQNGNKSSEFTFSQKFCTVKTNSKNIL